MSSHWYQMYSSLVAGKESHKRATDNPIIAWYYQKIPLFTLCCANELTFIALYFMHHNVGWVVTILGAEYNLWSWVFYLSLAPTVLKHCISVVQLVVASKVIVGQDIKAYRKEARKSASSAA